MAKDKREMKRRQSTSSARKMKKRRSVNDGAESWAGTSREEKWSGKAAKCGVAMMLVTWWLF